jgi:hypothetical protein
VGFEGTKEEDLNKAPIFGRPRVTVGLPWKLALSISYVPPIEVFEVKPHLFALALERPLVERGPWALGLRTYGQVGEVEGAFTCPSHAARFEPGSPNNPFGCNGESDDTAMQRYWGLELSSSYRLRALGGLTPYVGLGANYLSSRFHTKATTFGIPDHTKLAADEWTVSLTTGITYPLTKRIDVSVGMFYTPLWVTRPPSIDEERDSLLNVRTEIAYRFR